LLWIKVILTVSLIIQLQREKASQNDKIGELEDSLNAEEEKAKMLTKLKNKVQLQYCVLYDRF